MIKAKKSSERGMQQRYSLSLTKNKVKRSAAETAVITKRSKTFICFTESTVKMSVSKCMQNSIKPEEIIKPLIRA